MAERAAPRVSPPPVSTSRSCKTLPDPGSFRQDSPALHPSLAPPTHTHTLMNSLDVAVRFSPTGRAERSSVDTPVGRSHQDFLLAVSFPLDRRASAEWRRVAECWVVFFYDFSDGATFRHYYVTAQPSNQSFCLRKREQASYWHHLLLLLLSSPLLFLSAAAVPAAFPPLYHHRHLCRPHFQPAFFVRLFRGRTQCLCRTSRSQ